MRANLTGCLAASMLTVCCVSSAEDTTSSVHVRVAADRPGVALVQLVDSVRPGRVEHRATPVCVAPCEADVAARGAYRIVGRGVTPSPLPLLPDASVFVRVQAGNRYARIAGLWTMLAGLTQAAAGGAIVGLDALGASIGPLSASPNPSALLGGAVLLASGVISALIGAVLYGDNATSVAVRPVMTE